MPLRLRRESHVLVGHDHPVETHAIRIVDQQHLALAGVHQHRAVDEALTPPTQVVFRNWNCCLLRKIPAEPLAQPIQQVAIA